MKKKDKKNQPVLTKKDLTKQPIGTALRGVVSERVAGVVKAVINKKLEKAYNEMISRHAKGESWGQLSLFSTQEVQEKYLGDNKLVLDINIKELTTDPKRYQELYNAVCRLAYVDIVVPIGKPDENGESTLLVTKMFNLLIRANTEEVEDKDGNITYRYKRGSTPVVGLTMERVVAEYIYSLDKGYSDLLLFPILESSSKYYSNFYSFLCDYKRNEPREVTISYTDVRKLAALGSVEDDTAKGEAEIEEEAMEARKEAIKNGTPDLAPTDEDIAEMKRNNTRYYIVFSQFYKRILKPVMEEMKENADDNISDIWFEVEKIYSNGRAKNPDKISFIIHLSELGKELQNDKEATKEVMAMEERLRNDFKQTPKQIRTIMKNVPLKFRDRLKRKMAELSAAKQAGKIKIDSDEGAYWNVTFTNFIEKLKMEMEGEKLPFAEEKPSMQPEQNHSPAKESELSSEDQNRWGRVHQSLRTVMGDVEYHRWFSGDAMQLLSVTEQLITIEVPSRTYWEMVGQEYGALIKEEIEKEWGSGCEIHFTTKG